MKNTISKQQKTIIWVSVALVLAASAVSNMLENQHQTNLGAANQANSSNWQMPNNSSNWQMPNNSGSNFNNNSADMNSDSIGSDAAQNQDNMPVVSSGGFGTDSGAVVGSNSSNSDMGSSAITDGYWDRQEIQDGIAHDQSNQILDQTTVQNQNTGETFQVESGSSNYYQSPSADAAMGGSGIVGVDAGGVVPSDGTQLSVVTGSDAGSSSSSSSSSAGE
jgi:hypothetical protein